MCMQLEKKNSRNLSLRDDFEKKKPPIFKVYKHNK